MNLNAEQICLACNGKFIADNSDPAIFANSAKIDSREISYGDMFIAVNGQNVDGHKFIPDVIKKRATVVISEKAIDDDTIKLANDYKCSVIKVDNSQTALADIATAWRNNIMGEVVGITGSVGKTSTKKLCFEALSIKYQTTANVGNLNNEYGLPITICSSNFHDDYIVSEMGTSAPGELTDLCNIAKPTWGVITNIGEAHIEFFGSKENLAKEKSALAQSIPKNFGKMFLPTDDEYRDFIIDFAKLKERNVDIIFYGGTKYHTDLDAPQVWYEDLEFDEKGKPSFIVCMKDLSNSVIEKHLCKLNLTGKHNVLNACAAIAVAVSADINISKVLEVLKISTPEKGRQEVYNLNNDIVIIDDAYNANPQSMISALESFAGLNNKGRKIAFLGDMLELGSFAIKGHEDVGKAAFNNNIDILICTGELSKDIAKAAIDAGMNKEKVNYFEEVFEAEKFLRDNIQAQDAILFKASNSLGFQNIVKDLVI